MNMRCFQIGLLLWAFTVPKGLAESFPNQPPPTPQEVANTVSNYWIGQDFTSLSSYVTNLYTSYSNYVPAILAASFYDVTYRGKLSEATNKLHRVQALVSSDPESFSDLFKDILAGLIDDVSEEIALHASMGTTPSQLESNASPSAVRSASSRLDRDIIILFSAPATNITLLKPVILDAQVRLKPEALEVSPGILTAFVRLPEGYPVSGITSATCDGAPSERMMPNDDGTEMIIKFRRQDIEKALAQSGQTIDTNFVVRGTWQGAAGTYPFQGSASIKKIVGPKN